MPPPPPPPPAPTLPEELLEEIFLRLPPAEPECLVRASLASKLWLGRLTSPRFRGRYRELHGSPPMLGFFSRLYGDRFSNDPSPRFISTGKFSVRFPEEKDRGRYEYDVHDCRHGRVLLGKMQRGKTSLAVWNPMTGRHSELDALEDYHSHGAAVLCAVTGCDHTACHDGPFRAVYIGLDMSGDGGWVANAHASLSQMGEWSKPCCHLGIGGDSLIDPMPPVLTQDALHFILVNADYDANEDDGITILKYDLGSNSLSQFDAPVSGYGLYDENILMAMEDGRLGFARVERKTLYLWSRQIGSNGVESWTAGKIIDLHGIPPIQNPKIKKIQFIGSVEGSDIIFMTTNIGIYQISLKSLEWKKIWKEEYLYALVPYIIFYDPPERANRCDVAH